MMTTLLTLMLMVAQLPATQAPDRDPAAALAYARQLYAAASYEDALDRLTRIAAPDPIAEEVDTYRALCLIALGRTRESEGVVERILERNPRFVLDEREVSPRLGLVFKAVRARMLPVTARNLYAAARTSFDAGRYAAAVLQLREVLDLLESDKSSDTGVADLRVLAEGFLRLAEAAQSGAVAPEEAARRAMTFAGVAGPGAIYSILDRDVIGPVETSRPVPIMATPPGGQHGLYQGLVEIVISEKGRVEQAVIRRSINVAFDAEIIAATSQWRFQPATRDGKPVRFRRSYEVIGHSR